MNNDGVTPQGRKRVTPRARTSALRRSRARTPRHQQPATVPQRGARSRAPRHQPFNHDDIFNVSPPANLNQLPANDINQVAGRTGRRILVARRRRNATRGVDLQFDVALQQVLWQSVQPRTPNENQRTPNESQITPNESQVENVCTPDNEVSRRQAEKNKKEHKPLPEEPERKRAKLELGCCPICLDELGSKPLSVTKCGHIFCTECVKNRNVTRCPKCRKSLRGSGAVHSLFL